MFGCDLAKSEKALGIVEADADTKAASARTAMLFSRTNTLLSIPMLYAMVAAKIFTKIKLFKFIIKETVDVTGFLLLNISLNLVKNNDCC